MSDLLSREALYDKATALEAQALDYVGKLIERDGDEPSVEWKIGSAILTERTAFKYDVYDAPSVGKEGHWIDVGDGVLQCSECEETDNRLYLSDKFCPNCGARMSDD